MKRIHSIIAIILMATPLFQDLPALAQVRPDQIAIPYTKHVLKNGLTLLHHQDTKAPIVAVNVWYHVGSKNEKPGRTGFAHLFEHLMFNGSENNNEDYFMVMERIGATDLNGTTNEDRTNYFQNVPKTAVDVALWMESDRMGHLLGAIDQAKLDEQRGVVQNEKRQYENEPYGMVDDLIVKATWPAGHPYSWTVIGSMEDLNAASLDDVKEWFKTYYGASNATLVVAGDIDFETAKQKVEMYFGDVPPGPPVAHHDVWIAKRSGEQRQRTTDRVPQARIYKVWNVPQFGADQNLHLDLVSDVLGSGKNSRLFKRLVYDDQIATNVSAYIDAREIASQFIIVATAKPGVELSRIEKAIDEELANFFANGVADKELQRVKIQYLASFVRGVERIGGFGGKSDVLAQGQVYAGNPERYKDQLAIVSKATKSDLLLAAKEWLSDGVYVLEVHPFPDYSASKEGADRSKLPVAGSAPDVKFPSVQRGELSNGLKIVLAERKSVPVVNFWLLVDAGTRADVTGKPGTAALAMNMLDEGTKSRTSLQISEELALLGAALGSGANLDQATVTLSTLKPNLEKALQVYTDVILNPSFPQTDFERLKKQQLAGIKQEKVTPIQMGLRVLPKLLYGEGHPYANPFTGSGYEKSVEEITRGDLVNFHTTFFKPNNATLVVAGDITMNEVKPLLEKMLAGWKRGDVKQVTVANVAEPKKPVVYLINRPGSLQSVVFAALVAPPKNNPDEIPLQMMNTVFGGQFTSRINMNLREDKHWSYGVGSILWSAAGQRPYFAYAPVQGDKTKETIMEFQKELEMLLNTKPITSEELEKTKGNESLSLPGSWETIGSVGGSLVELVRFGYPDTYWDSYASKIRSVSLEQVHAAAKLAWKPNQLVWVVIGDRAKIEDGIRSLNIGELKFLDGDGNEIK